MSNSSPPRVALIETENSIVYSGEEQEVSYQLYDILWSDGKATQEVRPVSDGVVPIGLCVIPTNWLDEGEKARFVSLKYMSSRTPEIGTQGDYDELYWGLQNTEDDPLQQYYIPYIAKNELNKEQDLYDVKYYLDSSNSKYKTKDIKDLRIRENWLYTLNYCKENPGKYAIGDINGKQNTINISVEGNWQENKTRDMKYCVSKYAPEGTQAGEWYIPALGELLQFTFKLMIEENAININDKMAEISNIYPQNCEKNFNYSLATYWSSTVKSATEAYNCVVFSDNIDSYNDDRSFDRAAVAFLQR